MTRSRKDAKAQEETVPLGDLRVFALNVRNLRTGA